MRFILHCFQCCWWICSTESFWVSICHFSRSHEKRNIIQIISDGKSIYWGYLRFDENVHSRERCLFFCCCCCWQIFLIGIKKEERKRKWRKKMIIDDRRMITIVCSSENQNRRDEQKCTKSNVDICSVHWNIKFVSNENVANYSLSAVYFWTMNLLKFLPLMYCSLSNIRILLVIVFNMQ